MSSGEDKWELVVEATEWSLVTSSGFLLAAVFISLGMHIFQTKKGTRDVGGFAIFMILLEMVDAVPEAAVLAQSTITRSIGWSFVLSILFLNIVNTSASCVDFLATKESKHFHRFLFVLLFFCIGMLSYSISTDVYGRFAELFKEHDRNRNHLLVLILGTVVGFSLIILIMKLEHKIREKKQATEEEEEKKRLLADSGVTPDLDDEDEESAMLLADIYKEIMEVTPKMEKLFEKKKRKRLNRSVSRDSSSDTESFAGSSYTLDEDESRSNFEGDVLDTTERVGVLTELSFVLKVLQRWKKEHGSTPILEETNQFVRNMVKSNIHGNEDDDEETGEKKKLIPATKADDPELEREAERGFQRRVLQFLGCMIFVFLWSVVLTFGLALLLYYTSTRQEGASDYLDAFSEGLSGGAFLSTIAGTMVFRIQQDYFGSQWATETSKFAAMFTFIFGIVFSSLIDMLDFAE